VSLKVISRSRSAPSPLLRANPLTSLRE
jgi:hypothetical protein